MRVLLLGHSYVREIEKLGHRSFKTDGTEFSLEYLYQSGGNYDTFLNDPSLLYFAHGYDPHYIIVILAGNAICEDIKNSELYKKARDFYLLVKSISALC